MFQILLDVTKINTPQNTVVVAPAKHISNGPFTLHFKLSSSDHHLQLHFHTKAAAWTLARINSLRKLEEKYGGQEPQEQSSLMMRDHYWL